MSHKVNQTSSIMTNDLFVTEDILVYHFKNGFQAIMQCLLLHLYVTFI